MIGLAGHSRGHSLHGSMAHRPCTPHPQTHSPRSTVDEDGSRPRVAGGEPVVYIGADPAGVIPQQLV